jgi:hypothetical protein
MRRVTLVLANGPGLPDGSEAHRVVFDAVLDAEDQLDATAWHAAASPWPAQRLWPDEPPRQGEVQHDAETGWSLRFGSTPAGRELSEPIRISGAIRPGQYVTLIGEGGRDWSYRVVSLT